MILPLFSVTSMIMQSLGPGPLRESPSSKLGGTGVPPLAFEFGELDLLRRVGVGQGVRLGLLRRVRTVRVTTPFFSCWKGEKRYSLDSEWDEHLRIPSNFLFQLMIQRNGPEINSPELILFWGFMHRCRCFWGDWAVYLEGLNGLLVREALERLSIHFQYLITWTVEKETFTSEKAQDKSQRQWKSSCHVVEVQQTMAPSALQLLYHDQECPSTFFQSAICCSCSIGENCLNEYTHPPPGWILPTDNAEAETLHIQRHNCMSLDSQ